MNLKDYQKNYRDTHKDQYKNYRKDYINNNREAISKKRHEYYLKNKEVFAMRYENNKIQIQEKQKQWRLRNKISRREYIRNKRSTDINCRISHNISSRVRIALEGNPKFSTTMKLVGCSVERLKFHLESMFQQGMNWDNYGKWHIDHIEPCANFDLSIPEEQTACFHYTNLQPLWAKDNLRKNKY